MIKLNYNQYDFNQYDFVCSAPGTKKQQLFRAGY